jgi:hypothetical protein
MDMILINDSLHHLTRQLSPLSDGLTAPSTPRQLLFQVIFNIHVLRSLLERFNRVSQKLHPRYGGFKARVLAVASSNAVNASLPKTSTSTKSYMFSELSWLVVKEIEL